MTNVAKTYSKQEGPGFLRQALIDVEQQFLADLECKRRSITHDGSLGDAVEDDWIALLRRYLPDRYKVTKAFAIDHRGQTPDQLDCIIYDAHFTPALFGQNNYQYVPAEAVYASFEIKQTVNAGNLIYAAEKIASVRALHRTSAPIPWANGVNPPKQPFPIIGGLLAMEAEWIDGLGQSFTKNLEKCTNERKLDLVLTARHGFCDQLGDNEQPTIASGSGALIRGLFRLLNALRDRATVSAVEWDKYEAALIPS